MEFFSPSGQSGVHWHLDLITNIQTKLLLKYNILSTETYNNEQVSKVFIQNNRPKMVYFASKSPKSPTAGGQGRRQKNFQGGGQRKKDQKIIKRLKNSTIMPLLGRGGGNGKKDRKKAKIDRKIALFSLYLLNMYHVCKSRGATTPLPRCRRSCWGLHPPDPCLDLMTRECAITLLPLNIFG